MTVVRVSPDAQADVERAAEVLEAARQGYGARMIAAFRTAITAIRNNPRMYPETEDGFAVVKTREYYITRYGYRVIYIYDEGIAVIIAVIHAARRPGAWHSRLPDSNELS